MAFERNSVCPVCHLVTAGIGEVKNAFFFFKCDHNFNQGFLMKRSVLLPANVLHNAAIGSKSTAKPSDVKDRALPRTKNDCPGCGWLQIPATTAPGLTEPT